MLNKLKEALAKYPDGIFYAISSDIAGKSTHLQITPHSPAANIYSVSKNVTSTAVGLAFDRGLLSPEDKALGFFPEYENIAAEGFGDVTLRHLLTQSTGIESGTLFEDDRYTRPEKDWLALVLARPLAHSPGTFFAYDNGNYYLLSHIIQRSAGLNILDFLREELFAPMDIKGYAWEVCPLGQYAGATGLFMSARDLCRLGRLWLDRGEFEGKRLISREWMEMSLSPSPADNGYGFGFWLHENGVFCANGAHNQQVYMSEEYDAVVAVQGYDDSGVPLGEIIGELLREG